MSFNVDFSYDSHVHFFGVGIPAAQWKIEASAEALALPTHLENMNFIKGFGWTDNLNLKSFDDLTTKYPNKKFCLSYFDGHTSFVSKNLISSFGFKPEGAKELTSGFLISEGERDDFYTLLPVESFDDLRAMALHAQNIFLNAGVSKIRHLTANKDHWAILKSLEQNKELKLTVEVFFSEFMGQSLDEAIKSFKQAKDCSSKKVQACGIKLFYDGSFSSNTAYTSAKKFSVPKISRSSLKNKLLQVFQETSSSVAVHTIGDLALEDCLEAYAELCKLQPSLPALHLEHAPIFTKKSLELLEKEQLNCVFHFQPSHWIQDQHWYAKNKSQLIAHEIYPFEFLQKNNYQFFFGSDAPVVETSKEKTLEGLELIKNCRL